MLASSKYTVMVFFKIFFSVKKLPTLYVTLPLSSSTEKWILNKVLARSTKHAASGASVDSNPNTRVLNKNDLLWFIRLTCQTTPYNLGEYLMAP